jgi:hypothetical protein
MQQIATLPVRTCLIPLLIIQPVRLVFRVAITAPGANSWTCFGMRRSGDHNGFDQPRTKGCQQLLRSCDIGILHIGGFGLFDGRILNLVFNHLGDVFYRGYFGHNDSDILTEES